MYSYETRNMRNICLISHGGAGKTSLCEALLYKAGAIDRLGKVLDGNTTSDYDPEEVKRKISINTSIAPLEWKNVKINIIDTPGYFDFVGEMIEGVRVSGGAVIVVSGKSGVSAGTEKAWKLAKEKDIPVIFFVNKLDDPKADFQRTVSQLDFTFGKSVAPLIFPIKEGDKFTGFVDVVKMQAKMFADDGKIEYKEIPSEYMDVANE